jgi:predicted nucleotidyltransferase
MLNKKIITQSIQDNLGQIRRYGIRKIGVFGSFIRSSQSEKSDIDVLIEFYPAKKSFDNYMELKFFLEKLLHRKVNLVIKDAVKPRIRPYILGEVLYA